MQIVNLLAQLPDTIFEEKFESLVTTDKVRIERIVSHGQTSPEFGWYDQDEHEWVMVLKGHAVLEFFDGETLHMQAGDAIDIKAHVKHKVLATALDEPTVWLAVFYQ